jgi:hypothetical protein
VLLHDKDSRGALAYLALAGEMIRREEEKMLAQRDSANGGHDAAVDDDAESASKEAP